MAAARKGKGPRRAMIRIRADGYRPPFHSERQLHICGADIYRGKDGTMTILMPIQASYIGTVLGYCHFSVSEKHGVRIHGGLYRFEATEFINKDGYLEDRNMT